MGKIRSLLALALGLALTTPALAAEGSIGLTPGTGTNAALTAADGAGNNSFLHALCGGAAATMGTACANQIIVNSSGQALILATLAGTLPAFAATPTFILGAGSALAGKVGIDQTTPGTTNNVTATPPANVTLTNCAGSIATGGTAVTAIAAQTTLHGFTITNNDSTTGGGEPLWISLTTTATTAAPSNPIPAPTAVTFAGMGSFTSPPGMGTNHLVSVDALTTGHTFGCFWW